MGVHYIVIMDVTAVFPEKAMPVHGMHGVPCALGNDDGCARISHIDEAGEAVGHFLDGPVYLGNDADFSA